MNAKYNFLPGSHGEVPMFSAFELGMSAYVVCQEKYQVSFQHTFCSNQSLVYMLNLKHFRGAREVTGNTDLHANS